MKEALEMAKNKRQSHSNLRQLNILNDDREGTPLKHGKDQFLILGKHPLFPPDPLLKS